MKISRERQGEASIGEMLIFDRIIHGWSHVTKRYKTRGSTSQNMCRRPGSNKTQEKILKIRTKPDP